MNRFITLFICGFVLHMASTSHAQTHIVDAQPNIFDGVNIVSAQDVTDLIKGELLNQGVGDDIELTLTHHEKGVKVSLPSKQYEMSIESLDIKRVNRRFSANLRFAANDTDETIQVEGRFESFVSLPVAAVAVPYKGMIEQDDIEWIRFPAHRLKHDTITDDETLAGYAAKRSLQAMRPIRLRDLIRPQIISRNDVVDMVFRNGLIEVKTVGVAMQDGSKGEVIKVRNASSNKVVQAIVRDERVVTTLSTIN